MNLKSSKAITLVALIITIIVLLILAGVSISLVLGQNGILNNAKASTEMYENGKLMEQNNLDEYAAEIDRFGEGGTISAADVEFKPTDTSWKVTTVKEALDSLYGV